jgi:hypothetical protein
MSSPPPRLPVILWLVGARRSERARDDPEPRPRRSPRGGDMLDGSTDVAQRLCGRHDVAVVRHPRLFSNNAFVGGVYEMNGLPCSGPATERSRARAMTQSPARSRWSSTRGRSSAVMGARRTAGRSARGLCATLIDGRKRAAACTRRGRCQAQNEISQPREIPKRNGRRGLRHFERRGIDLKSRVLPLAKRARRAFQITRHRGRSNYDRRLTATGASLNGPWEPELGYWLRSHEVSS